MEFHVSEWSRLLMDTSKLNKQYFYLNGRIDYEMINSFLNFYNSLSSETNEVMIYLNSEGGLYDCMQILLDIMYLPVLI